MRIVQLWDGSSQIGLFRFEEDITDGAISVWYDDYLHTIYDGDFEQFMHTIYPSIFIERLYVEDLYI